MHLRHVVTHVDRTVIGFRVFILTDVIDHQVSQRRTREQPVDQPMIERGGGQVALCIGYVLHKIIRKVVNVRNLEPARECDIFTIGGPQLIDQVLRCLPVGVRHAHALERFDERLMSPDAEDVPVEFEHVDRVLEVGSKTTIALQQQSTLRVYVYFIRMRGQEVALLGQEVGTRDDGFP